MNQYDISELKIAALVLRALADVVKDPEAKSHAKILTFVVTKAVKELEPLMEMV